MALDRREFIRKTLAAGAASSSTLIEAAGLGCSPNSANNSANNSAASQPAAATRSPIRDQAAAECVVPIHQTAGPFFSHDRLIRSDLREDRDGAPLTLSFDVVSAEQCKPLSGLQVAIWHSDAHGVYGGFNRQGHRRDVDARGQTFLRGTQVSSRAGRVTFSTIVPGWYPSRVTHIHLRVIDGDSALVTTQIYLPDQVTRRVYETGVYRDHGWRDTEEKADSVLRRARERGATLDRHLVRLAMKEQSRGWRAHAVIGVP